LELFKLEKNTLNSSLFSMNSQVVRSLSVRDSTHSGT
jgi:hypothetical protein